MMTLVSMSITFALAYSLVSYARGMHEGFFVELVTLIDVMLLGHWLEMRSIRAASGALVELARLIPDTAERIEPDGTYRAVATAELHVGDLVLVRPGASVPADGFVEEGESMVNEALITGESKPVRKRPGDSVIGGTINGEGSLRVRVSAVGDNTTLARIMRLVREAQESKSRTQLLADAAAGWLFYVALATAAISGVVWYLIEKSIEAVFARVATVLVIACPHALGLAIPLVVAITTSLAAKSGILIRDRRALERARSVDRVVFDKTGTLTEGKQGVVAMIEAEGWDEIDVLSRAASAEGDSEHPIAAAIRNEAARRSAPLRPATGFTTTRGVGIEAFVDGSKVAVGGSRMLERVRQGNTEPISRAIAEFAEREGSFGRTVVFVLVDGVLAGAFSIADVIRPESREAVARLKSMGITCVMVTGDGEGVARAVAREIGLDKVYAGVLPEGKVEIIRKMKEAGHTVAMVGDGINDAAALVAADVGIAIGSGTDVAVESAGIILVRSNPLDVVAALVLARASYRIMVQNLWWAAGYNIVALPVAAGALAGYGITLSPAIGAVLMSVSTIVVALNAQLVRRVSLPGGATERAA
jgi:Cu2+-exporting ATPase